MDTGFGSSAVGWELESSAAAAATPSSTVSTPSNVQHLSRVTNIGQLNLISTSNFFGRTTSSSWMCTLSGDTLTCVPEGSTTFGRRRKIMQYTVSAYTRVNFDYDHTVQEQSHERNRMVLVREETNHQHTTATTPTTTTTTTTILSVPTDKEMARWETSIRAIVSMQGRCYSTLRDTQGRLRPYSRGLPHSNLTVVCDGETSTAAASSSAGGRSAITAPFHLSLPASPTIVVRS